jgi:hypothetical protein
MNTPNENQHWISRVLLKRFKEDRNPFQCYQVATDEWVPKGIERVCAAPGYNQLLVSGKADNTLEEAFSKIESGLPITLKALEEASKHSSTILTPRVHENLCWYCSFLSGVAPQSKAGAVVSFFAHINLELERNWNDLLKDLGIPEVKIVEWREQHAAGQRLIVEAENLVQLIYRIQFRRNYPYRYIDFKHTKWTVRRIPIEIPMSDVGIVPMLLENQKASHYLLPFGPHLLLEGMFHHDVSKNSSEPIVYGAELDHQQVQYRFDCICASAITELICRSKPKGIPEARARAKRDGTHFHKITDPKSIKVSGLADVGEGDLRFRMVSADEYRRVVHSYMQPAS